MIFCFISVVIQSALLRFDVLLLAVRTTLAKVGLRAAIALRVAVGLAFTPSYRHGHDRVD